MLGKPQTLQTLLIINNKELHSHAKTDLTFKFILLITLFLFPALHLTSREHVFQLLSVCMSSAMNFLILQDQHVENMMTI